MFAVIEVTTTVIATGEDRKRLEIWCLKHDLAEEIAGFTPSSCDGGIRLRPNVLIIELPDKESH